MCSQYDFFQMEINLCMQVRLPVFELWRNGFVFSIRCLELYIELGKTSNGDRIIEEVFLLHTKHCKIFIYTLLFYQSYTYIHALLNIRNTFQIGILDATKQISFKSLNDVFVQNMDDVLKLYEIRLKELDMVV